MRAIRVVLFGLVFTVLILFFQNFSTNEQSHILTDGRFVSLQSRYTNKCLDLGDAKNRIDARLCTPNTKWQNWKLRNVSGNFYLLESEAKPGKCLDFHADRNNGQVRVISCNSKYWSSQWEVKVVNKSNSHFILKNRFTEKILQ